MIDRQLQNAIQQSVQTADINLSKQPVEANVGGDFFYGMIEHPRSVVPQWGTKSRAQWLRRLSYNPYNFLFPGALSALITKVLTIPTEIKGGKILANRYSAMLRNSDFHDWESFISRLLWDYGTQDDGAFVEIIGAGRSDKPIKGGVIGIAHLDSISCYATKVNEFPVLYWNEENGSRHLLHRDRVYRFVDMPSPKRLAYGTGLCSLSRYAVRAYIDMQIATHDTEMLNDLPPAGLLAVSGMTQVQWRDASRAYEADRNADGASVFRSTMVVHGIDPSNPIKVESIPFSALPENFDVKAYTDQSVNILALDMGIDPQDIWPLSSSAMGSAMQSEVLAAKARGKMFGHILQMITRFININVLPPELEFQFKFADADESKETANTAKVWVDIVNSATFLSDEEKRRLMVDNVEAFAEVLLDDAGELIELPDDDPKPADESQEVIAPDDIPNTPQMDAPSVTQTDDTSNQQPGSNLPRPGGQPQFGAANRALRERPGVDADLGERRDTDTAQKDYPATKSEFIGDVAAAISDAATGEISKAAFAIRMRAALSKYGKAAYLDGLAEGGIDVSSIPSEDSDIFAGILAAQSQYVTDARSTITDFTGDAKARAQMWQKSLDPFYYGAVESADKNGLYTFEGDDGAESCKDCRSLKGQTHRMSWWIKNKKRPVVDANSFECGGWKCNHMLKKKTKAA
jgi:hypothetical protein